MSAKKDTTDIKTDYSMCGKVLQIVNTIDDRIVTVLQCGTNFVSTDEYVQNARSCGLDELADRYERFITICESSRHTTSDKCGEIFTAAADVQRYIKLCRKKLALYSAIYNMEEHANDLQ